MEPGSGCDTSSPGTPPGLPMSSPLRGTTLTQPGRFCPSRGLSHPRKGAASPGTPAAARRRGGKPRPLLGRGMRVCPSRSWSWLTLPAPGGSPPSPGRPVPAAFPGTVTGAGGGEPVCQTRRSCAAEAPASPPAQRLAGKAAAVYTGVGALALPPAGLCRAAPRCFALALPAASLSRSPLRSPAGAASPVCEVCGCPPRPPDPAPGREAQP